MSSADLFRSKAAEYAKYRFDYPESVIIAAFKSVELDRSDVVADIGSGTGMLSRWFLERGNRVFGVEPDPGMRDVAEKSLSRFGVSFASLEGTAEQTSLPDGSVTLATAGNAFHYFDPQPARAEVERILRPGGRVLLIGHDTASKPNPFTRAYVDFIAGVAPHEAWVFHESDRMSESLKTFFGSEDFQLEDLGDFAFRFTWDDLRGRFLSTSVAPPTGDPRRSEVVSQLSDVFDRFEQEGAVSFQLRWRYTWSKLRRGL
jgi:ubiquinone/menaquinone biosynthesis C-methylase UbiE